MQKIKQGKNQMKQTIDTQATLQRFTDSEITVTDWCAARGFKRDRFYQVVKNVPVYTRTAFIARKILAALKKEGLLVLRAPADGCSEAVHIDQYISSSQK